MKLRGLMGLTMASAILCWAAIGSGKSADCARAEQEMVAAQRTLSQATRDADRKAADYQACVQQESAASCKAEHRALRTAKKAKRDAQAAYRYAAARVKQVCGG